MNSETNNTSAAPEASVACWGCDTRNASNRKFCGDCGASLWVDCEKCKEPYSAGEKFCGSCGANLYEALEAQRKKAEQQIQEARDFIAAGDFDKAVRALGPVLRIEHPGVTKQRESAGKLREEIEANRSQTTEQAGELLKAAKAAFDQHQYEEALEHLQKIPVAIRTEEVEDKIASVQSKATEVKMLVAELKSGFQQKQYDGVFARISRLQRLCPGHPIVAPIAKETVRWIYAVSGKLHGKRRYSEAVRLLAQVPDQFAPEALQARREKYRELAQLHSELKTADTATLALANVAKRLHELEPETKADQVFAKIMSKRKAHKRLGDAKWWSPDEKPYLSAEVKHFYGFAPLAVGEKLPVKSLTEHPSAFLPAIGAALQQMGAGSISVNLIKSSGGLLSKLSFFGSKKVDTGIGLDIGDAAIKAVHLARVGDKIVVENLFHFAFSDQVYGDAAQRSTEVDEGLNSLATAFEIKNQPIALIMPSQQVLGRFFDLPKMADKKLADAIRFEIENQIPFPVDQITASHQLLSGMDDEEASALRVMVLAAKNEKVELQLTPLLRRKWTVDTLQCDALAVANFHRYAESLLDSEQKKPTIAWLDVGNNSRIVVTAASGNLWFRNLPVGGREMTMNLSKSLRLTRSDAEVQKHRLPPDENLAQSLGVLENVHEQIAAEVLRSLEQFSKDNPQETIEEVRIVGDAGRTHGLLRALRTGPKASELGWGE